jgi:predicted anti-sigma-YlaC factor YlaD
VNCVTARTAISADIDEDVDGLTRERVSAHLAECSTCRDWRELAHVVTRRARMGVAAPSPQLAEQVAAAVRADLHRRRARRHWLAVARAVAIAGLLQLLATVPLLLLARGHASGGGRVHVLGLVELAIGAGFFVGALVVLWQARDQQVLGLARPAASVDADQRADVSEVA